MCQIRVNLRRWACLLAALACLLALLPLPAHAAGAASKVVRVGWYEDAYNITGKNGERSGYAYEYEQSVAAYTGWTYEYVKAGWSDLLQMMKSGEIDLMAGVSYTEDRAQDMLFSELPMGREIYYLYADLAHTDISASDLRTLNGKRIALLKTSVQPPSSISGRRITACICNMCGPTASSRASSRRRAARSTASFPPRRLPGWNTACLPLPRPAAPTSTLPSAGPGRT